MLSILVRALARYQDRKHSTDEVRLPSCSPPAWLQRKRRVKGKQGKSFETEAVPADSFFNIFDPPMVSEASLEK